MIHKIKYTLARNKTKRKEINDETAFQELTKSGEILTRVRKMKVIPRKNFHKIKIPHSLIETSGWGVYDNSSKKDLNIPGARAISFESLLSPDECKDLLEQLEAIGYEDMAKEFPVEYRSNDRTLIVSEDLAHYLWCRIQHVLDERDIMGIRPVCFGNKGTWRPTRLNECFKFAKYKPGAHFSPHIDGPWVPREDESSIYTVLIYLNEDYTGGETVFLEEGTSKEICKVPVSVGGGVIFNHDVYHEGKPVIEGTKYLLRTEIMFSRIDTESLTSYDRYSYEKDPDYQKALFLYLRSWELERLGDKKGFTKKYLKALNIQRKAQPSVTPSNAAVFKQALPYDVFLQIFSYFEPNELLNFFTVSKAWYEILHDGRLWRLFYLRKWPENTIEGNINSKGEFEANPVTKDWYTCYRQKRNLEQDFAVIVFDCGSHSTKSALKRKTEDIRACTVENVVAVVSGIFDLHIRRMQYERFYCGEDARTEFGNDCLERPIAKGHISKLSILPELWTSCYDRFLAIAKNYAVVMAEPPLGFQEDEKRNICRYLFEIYQVPSIQFVPSAVLSLYSSKNSSGIVVSAGHEVGSVTTVFNGKILGTPALFSPNSYTGVAEIIQEQLSACSEEEKTVLRNKILFTGGKSIGAFEENVKKELSNLIAFKVIPNEERILDVALGGIVCATLSNFKEGEKLQPKSEDDSRYKYEEGFSFYQWVITERSQYWFSTIDYQ